MLQVEDFFMANVAYVLYLAISIAMTVWVARVLSKSGEMFLIKCFGHDEELAKSTNHLLVIGFYLVNIGIICARLDGWKMDVSDFIPSVGSRIGISVLALGVMHLFNMVMIATFGKTVSGWVHHNSNPPRATSLPPSNPADSKAKYY
jgi:hypothetical protein